MGAAGASQGLWFASAKFRPTALPGRLVVRSALHDRLAASQPVRAVRARQPGSSWPGPGRRCRASRRARGSAAPVSALFLMLEKTTPDKAVEAMSKYGGTVLKTSLSNEDERELQEALHGSQTASQ